MSYEQFLKESQAAKAAAQGAEGRTKDRTAKLSRPLPEAVKNAARAAYDMAPEACKPLIVCLGEAIFAARDEKGGCYAAVTSGTVKNVARQLGLLEVEDGADEMLAAACKAGLIIPAVCFRYSAGYSLPGLAEYCRKPKLKPVYGLLASELASVAR